jgi:hypothetical protein
MLDFCKQDSNLLKTHRVLFLEIRSFENMLFRPAFRWPVATAWFSKAGATGQSVSLYILRMLKWGIYVAF